MKKASIYIYIYKLIYALIKKTNLGFDVSMNDVVVVHEANSTHNLLHDNHALLL